MIAPGLVVGELTIIRRSADRIMESGRRLHCWEAHCLCGKVVFRTEDNIRYAVQHGRNMACRTCRDSTYRGAGIAIREGYRERLLDRLRRQWAETGSLYSGWDLRRMADSIRSDIEEATGLRIEDLDSRKIPEVDPTWKETPRKVSRDELLEFAEACNAAWGLAAQHTLDVSQYAKDEARRQYEAACAAMAHGS